MAHKDFAWVIKLGSSTHVVRYEESILSYVRIYIDDNLVYTKRHLLGGTAKLNVDGRIITVDPIATEAEPVLIADGIRYEPAHVVVRPQDNLTAPETTHVSVQTLGEENVREEWQVVDIEHFPLDNRAGNSTLTVEHEVSNTKFNELSIGQSVSIAGGAAAKVLSALKLEIAASLSKELGQTVGQTVTRRQLLHFTVQPHSSVIYEVVWKRRIRTGEYLVSIRGTLDRVSYRLEYDLSYEIRSR